MKHQALARVFAVVLAVMCLLMGINGVVGLRKTQDEHDERIAYADRYAKRIETYVELDEKLKGSISYEDAYAELEKLVEAHDKDASQHKTDTAMYSAEKGGNTMGADLIYEAMPAIKAAKLELEKAKRQLTDGEELLMQAKQTYEANKPAIDGMILAANTGAQNCTTAADELNNACAALSALMAQEPQMPTMPVAPTPPEELPENPDEAAVAKYEEDMAKYKEEFEQYEADCAAAAEQQKTYEKEHQDWESECSKVKNVDFTAPVNTIVTESGNFAALVEGAAPILSAMGAGSGAGGDMPQIDPSMFEGIAAMTPTDLSNEQFLNTAGMLSGTLGGIAGGYSELSGGLNSIGSTIAEQEQELIAGKAKLEAGAKELEKGEQQAIGQLEMIWYNLGELEKDKEELEENKKKLDEEASVLSKKLMETDELKELENKRTSTRLILTGVKEVKEMYKESKDLLGSANAYLDNYKAETGRLYTGKLALNILAVIGAIAGFAGLPAAFEKIKKRFWLLVPVILCLVCACAADGINMALGLSQMYTALFTAIFAAIQLLVIYPKSVNASEEIE